MKAAALAAVALVTPGCATAPPPSPPPFAGGPAGPPEPGSTTADAPAHPVLLDTDPATGADAVPPPPAANALLVSLEPPYPLGRRPPPSEEIARWNQGGLGTLSRSPPPPEGHPMPRVVIDVLAVRGPHKAADIQRELRRMHWIEVVRCYSAAAYREPTLHGDATARVTITRAGKLISPRLISTTLGDKSPASCMSETLARHTVPSARGSSTATVKMHVSPGDDPIPPPAAALQPGPGRLADDAMSSGAAAGLSDFDACYRPALDYAPALWGRIAVRLHVTPTGEVDEAFEHETHFPDEAVLRCSPARRPPIAVPAADRR